MIYFLSRKSLTLSDALEKFIIKISVYLLDFGNEYILSTGLYITWFSEPILTGDKERDIYELIHVSIYDWQQYASRD